MITLCEAIARMEGWLVPTSRCRKNHNPGNIEYGRFAVADGATGTDGRFAIFPDDQTGFKAMSDLLTHYYVGATLEAAIAKWAPPTENATMVYAANVSTWTGIGMKTVLTAELCAPPAVAPA
jgi:hypothetical protein